MSILGFIAELAERDIKLWVEAGQLRFSAAKGALTPELRERIVAVKPELIAFLSAAGDYRQDAITPAPRAPNAPGLPLSFAQQRLFFLERLYPGGSAYNLPSILRVLGDLDVTVLKRVLQTMVGRHESLRTSFIEVDGVAWQVIHGVDAWRFDHVDLRHTPPLNRELQVRAQMDDAAKHAFDLERGPLFRVTLLQTGDAEHVLIVNMHHIISDGWSLDVFMNEMTALYNAFARGESSPLPEPSIQYADFAHWQRQWLRDEVLEKQLSYWRERLTGAPSLDLPLDRPRPSEQSYAGSSHAFPLAEGILPTLRALGREHGATLFMTMLTVYKLLLARYARQSDVCVGTSVAGRTRPELETMIGFFVNSLALRTDLTGPLSFTEALLRVKDTALGAFSHQDVPFEKIVDTLGVARDMGRSPVFQVMFDLQAAGKGQAPDMGGLRFERMGAESETAKFDLSLALIEEADVLEAILIYRTALFDPVSIARFGASLERLTMAVAKDPHGSLQRLELLDESERRTVLTDWNQTGADYPRDMCLHQLFERQARRTPEDTALVQGDRRYSYRGLDAAANHLAFVLQNEGVRLDMPVALFMPRTPELVIALLAVLKAGGAYVPLAVNLPEQRLAFMLADSAVSVVLISPESPVLPKDTQARGLLVDAISGKSSDAVSAPPETLVGPDNLAYMIYTSGSTGRPKGVMLPHRGVVNYLNWAVNAYGVAGGCGAPVHSPLGFDATVTSLFTPLICGREVVLLPEENELEHLAAALMDERPYSLVKLTPAHLNALSHMEICRQPAAEIKTTFVVGGEELTGATLQFWRTHFPKASFVNEYGPTETVVGCAVYSLKPDDAFPAGVPIGRPIANAACYLVDDQLIAVPAGMPGELLISGEGLARGYYGRPELTAERFIPNPFGETAGGRLYRSGDLSRLLPSGELAYLGRVDQQVKLRGYRIEPGEIEAVLERCPGVKQAAVLLRVDGQGNKQLAAYVTGTVDGAASYLAEHLPEYMLPNSITLVDVMPLTTNGKIDRAALAEMETAPTATEKRAPRNEKEQILAAIWAEVLNLDQVGVEDNFFSLGGDSILSIQVASRARRKGLYLSVKEIFKYQTVAQQAEAAKEKGGSANTGRAVESGPIPMSPVQHWFFELELDAPHHWNQSHLFSISPRVTANVLEKAVRSWCDHHDIFRARYLRENNLIVQTIDAAGGGTSFEVVDLSQALEENRSAALEAEYRRLQAGLSLDSGPVVRVALLQLNKQTEGEFNRLLIAAHHLVVDGVAWRFLLEDLETAIRAGLKGESVSLPPKTASFGAWSNALQRFTREGGFDAEVDYWRGLSRETTGRLPLDFPEGDNREGQAETVTVKLDRSKSEALLREVHRAYNTQIDDLLLAALGRVLARFTGEDSVLIAREGHGRESFGDDLDISRTAGWFTSIYPVLLRLAGIDTAGTLIKRVKEQLRAIPNQGIGFGALRYLSDKADVRETLRGVPHPQVSFNYLGQFDNMLRGGTEADPLFDGAAESGGPLRDPANQRTHLLEINGMVIDGTLRLGWSYSRTRHKRETIAAMAQAFLDELILLIDHCRRPEVRGYTPSDFPLARLDQTTLDGLLGELPEVTALYPLSPLQEGMLFHSLYAPDSPVYRVRYSYLFGPNTHVDAFEKAWRLVIQRHDILRSVFLTKGLKRPLQCVLRDPKTAFTRLDWRDRDPVRVAADLAAFEAADLAVGFQFDQAPPQRFFMITLPADEDGRSRLKFVWTHHHVQLDAWAAGIVRSEVFQAYSAYARGMEPELPPVTARYEDFIAELEKRDHEAEPFWRDYLDGFHAPTPLTMAKPPASAGKAKSHGNELSIKLGLELSETLQRFTADHGLTVNTLMQGVWGLLLSRYSGETDVLFGATTSGRPPELEGVEQIVGLFINTLPVRVNLTGDWQTAVWLKDLQDRQLEARRFESTPLTDIQTWSQVSAGTHLFESVLVFENTPEAEQEGEGESDPHALEVDDMLAFDQNDLPLTFVVAPLRNIVLRISYDSDRLEAEIVGRLFEHTRNLLENIVREPLGDIAALSMLSAGEKRRLLFDWNQTETDFPRDVCVHDLFEQRAGHTPDAVALIYRDRHISYRELDSRADRIAHQLLASGVYADCPVGLCLQRSPEMVMGLLAILKAGGAYVPLDPTYPQARLAYMSEHTGIGFIVSDSRAVCSLPGFQLSFTTLIDLDEVWAMDESDEASTVESDPASLAYVMYTSGSTGRPKGVMVTHQSLVNLQQAQIKGFDVRPGDRVLQFASMSFDASISEICMTLLSGAALLLADKDLLASSGKLEALLRNERVTTATLTPTVLRLLPADVPLRSVISAGEACDVDLVRKWSPGRLFTNAYGPTETTVCATMAACEPNDGDSPPIGGPIANTRVYVLDTALRPVPVGVPGQLFVGGVGLARGYWADPERTAAGFIEQPFKDQMDMPEEARLYQTGDLVRWRSDGKLEYLGRVDHQVKLRGFRVEPGEIEAVLCQHPAVREAVVLPNHGDGQTLAAYIVVAPGGEPPEWEQLRAHVGETLPDYMVPAQFTVLEAMPLTPNGKVDRQTLAQLEPDAPTSHGYTEPRDGEERIVADIWREVLGVPRVGAHDQFFALGGHSLLATQVISRLQQVMGVELTLNVLFDTPTVEGLAHKIRGLKGTADDSPPVDLTPIKTTSRDEPLPLSFAQQRLWFLDHLKPGNTAYNLFSALHLVGGLDLGALAAAFGDLAARHEVLRTVFADQQGQAVQLIREPAPWRLPLEDLTALAGDISHPRLIAMLETEAEKPFNLAEGPLLRVRLFGLAPDSHVLTIGMHHIISDGWSMNILVAELVTLYNHRRNGGDAPAPLPDLPIQYADYAAWQRNRLQGAVLAAQLDYWRTKLASITILALPADRPRPPVQSHAGAAVSFSLTNELTSGLHALCRLHGGTPFMALLAAFKLLLGRYSGQDDICVGTPVAGRTRPECEPLIGFFVNTLTLRTALDTSLNFVEALQRVKRTTLEAQAHQELPFERIVDVLGIERDTSRTPLFQVMFSFENTPRREEDAVGGDLQIHTLGTEKRTAQFDLTLSLVEEGERLAGGFGYATALFDEASIARLAESYQILLRGLIENPHRPVAQHDLMSSQARLKVLKQWNDTTVVRPQPFSMVDLFEAQTVRTPDAPALFFQDRVMRYGELFTAVTTLAARLRERGVSRGDLVAVCGERSLEMVVALYAVIYTGAAYVPLDPAYPEERLRFMLEDLGAPLVLAQSHLTLPKQAKVFYLDGAASPKAPAEVRAREALPTADDRMYVIYTSGSTGKPKGVMLPHGGVVNRLLWMQDTYQLNAADRVLQKTPYSFDVSVWEFFWPLISGAGLVIAEPEAHKEPAQLIELICVRRVSVVHFVPSMLNAFLDAPAVETCTSLRAVICSGEALPPATVNAFFVRLGGCELHNLYGPTEASIDVTAWPCHAEMDVVPIGKPIANTQTYVLDRTMRPVPVGVAGELFLGGVGLANGYLNRPDLTAERFTPNPFAEAAGRRLYRTGDLVRFRHDGAILYLGRTDFQVKIRGFRIELGEIERALITFPAIREAVVTAHGGTAKRLVAYLTLESGGSLDHSALRAFLAETLPEFMIPALFMVLPQLPLSPNGKVDRKALPAPERPSVGGPAQIEPQTEKERLLAAVWCEVLGLETVGVHANFFELGGDSIQCIQIISRANRAGLHLTVQQIFQHQTIATLVEVAGDTQIQVDAEQGTVTGDAPLTPIQRWFFEQDFEQPHHWNQSRLLRVDAALEATLLGQALEAVIAQHDILRAVFIPEGDRIRQSHAGLDPADYFRVVDLSIQAEAAQRNVLEREAAVTQAGFDLGLGPVARFVFFQLGDEKRGNRLLIVMHHLVIDAVSWRILLEDLTKAIIQLSDGQPIALGEKTTSFQQWSNGLAAHVRDGALDAERAYWQALAHVENPSLPFDQVDESDHMADVAGVTVRLSEAETHALLREAGKAFRTRPDELLLASLAHALCGWVEGDQVLIDLEGHGREPILKQADTTRTIGWFTTMFPVCLAGGRGKTSADLIKDTKERLRRIPNKGIGYGLLRYLDTDRGSRRGLADIQSDVLFNYLGVMGGSHEAEPDEPSLFGPAAESPGPNLGPGNLRHHALEITAFVAAGRLELHYDYGARRFQRENVAALAHNQLQALRELIAFCLSEEVGGFTPSDFPLVKLDQTTLDKLLRDLPLIEDVYPLAPMQEGMLFHGLYEPDSPYFFTQPAYTFEGAMDADVFMQAWQRVAQRQPILRTIFRHEGLERPLQLVLKDALLKLERHDWRHMDPALVETEMAEFLEADRRKGFRLDQEPPIRLSWIDLPPINRTPRQRFVFSHHHILLDAWSVGLVLDEVARCYDALMAGREPEFERVTAYRDFIAWLATQADAERYWRDYLRGFDTPTPLIVDRPSGDRKPLEARGINLALPRPLTESLLSLARTHGLTPNTLVQGVWALLLSRYARMDDVVFGYTVSGRPAHLAGVERMAGLFINTLPLRARVDARVAAVDWLKQLQDTQLSGQVHEQTPLVNIQGWSEVPANQALFESILVFENTPDTAAGSADTAQSGAASWNVSDLQTFEQSNYPLTVSAAANDALALRFAYDPNRFDEAAIQRLTNHVRTLFAQLAASPHAPLSQLTLLDESERALVLTEFNQTERDWGKAQTLHQLFERQAGATPNAPALGDGNETLSYRGLDTRANCLAHLLKARGITAETPVGICLERSVGAVAALLAVLKAGGAFVPLDPAHPSERLAAIIADCEPRVIFSATEFREKLGDHPSIVMLDQLDLNDQPDTTPNQTAPLDQAAYILYTSGSTGRPKGVVMSHRGIVNRLQWAQERYPLQPDDRFLQVASLGFDIAVWELFAAWLAGGQTVLAPADVYAEPARLIEFCAAQKITAAHFVPTLLHLLLREADIKRLNGLKRVFCGGEAVSDDLARHFQATLPAELHQFYGPTEAAINVTAYDCPQAREDNVLPIGAPIANTRLYTLDNRLDPVPVGVPGALFIGGVQLARAYLNRADLTAAAFVPDPFSQKPGARMYRSGDLALFQADGNLVFRGRADSQFKLRGIRIEPGDIEANLLSHGEVAEAIVLVREDRSGEAQLVAYLVPTPGTAPIAEALRQFMRQRLPEAMIPAAFVVLDAFPRTPNGKIDRKALPEPGGKDNGGVLRGETETALAGIWCEVLKREAVSPSDDFFELGGHSLLATRLASSIRLTFEVDLPLAAIFQNSRLAALAESVEQKRREKGEMIAPPITRAPRNVAPPLSFAQQRLWFVYQMDKTRVNYNMAFPFRFEGLFDPTAFNEAMGDVLARHEVLRTRFDAQGEHAVQLIDPVQPANLPMIDLSGLPENKRASHVAALVATLSDTPFHLETEHPFKTRVLRLSSQDHVVAMVCHHIAFDGWSSGILMLDLETAYRARLLTGAPAETHREPPALAYADYASWQQNWLRGDVLEHHLEYWRRKLGGLTRIKLPVDHAYVENPSPLGLFVPFGLSESLSRDVLALAGREGATLFMVLLAAYKALLYRYNGQTDLVVGGPIAGRNRRETEDLIGFFVNNLVLRTDLSCDGAGPLTFRGLLARVKQTALEAYAHQEVSFDKLVAELQPERVPGNQPFFQAVFALENLPDADEGSDSVGNGLPGGLEIGPFQTAERDKDVNYDLILRVSDSGDRVRGILSARAALFERGTIETMAARFNTLIADAAANPDKPLDKLAFLAAGERELQAQKEQEGKQSRYKRFKGVKPKSIRIGK